MLVRRFMSRVARVFGKKKDSRRERLARSRRRAFFEALESRRVFAADMEIFSFDLENGTIQGSGSFERSQVAIAERVATFVESSLDIDLSDVSKASISAKVGGGDGRSAPVYTFEMDGMEWDIREGAESLEVIDLDVDLFQNPDMPLDTNGNGAVDPLDALVVINYLNSDSVAMAPSRVDAVMSSSFVDVTGDNMVSPLDALMVINELNSRSDDPSNVLLAENDSLSQSIPASSTKFPVSDIDVLKNDFGDGLQIVGVKEPMFGTAEIVELDDGSQVIRYTPGDQFRTVDVFEYTIEDASGNQASAYVRVAYSLEAGEEVPFAVVAPQQVVGDAPGESILFQDSEGKALVSLDVTGDENASVGVLISFQANEAPFGVPVAGTISSDTAVENQFFPQINGAAWIVGTVAEVNAILAGLRFDPAAGFSAPEGIGVNIFAFLYGSLGVSTQFSSGLISVVVPKLAEAPIAKGDFFQFDTPVEPVRLKVLDNDSSPSGSTLQLVGVSQYPDASELSLSTPFGTQIEIDSETNEIILTPGFGAYESFVYIVSDAEGRLSQGKVAVSLIDFGA